MARMFSRWNHGAEQTKSIKRAHLQLSTEGFGDVGNGGVGVRLINPEHHTEMGILFTEPLTFVLPCFQALLQIVLIRHAAVHCYKPRRRSYPMNEAINQPLLRPQYLSPI